VLVVDEVHSFDPSMFSALKQFLRNFPTVPVLCMTATLPKTRRQQLHEECGLTVYDEKPDDLRTVAERPRYVVQRVEADQASPLVESALRDGKRVLWVVNNVRRAQALPLGVLRQLGPFGKMVLADGVPVQCYHSRFKLSDRRQRHREVVAAFQGQGGAVLGVTTQVCEMSLDLDADVLVTEIAPITALIQRMGRCIRETLPTPGRTGKVLIYSPPNSLPYDEAMMAGSETFVAELSGRTAVSQVDLEAALERWGPKLSEPPKACSFLESGPYAMANEATFREGDDYTIDAVLERDIEDFLSSGAVEKAAFVVPVPKRHARGKDPRLPPHLRTAPDSNYHSTVGFCDSTIF